MIIMKENRLDKAMMESEKFQKSHKGILPTYSELSKITGYTVNSLGILSCRNNVKLCRLLAKSERSANMKKALGARA